MLTGRDIYGCHSSPVRSSYSLQHRKPETHSARSIPKPDTVCGTGGKTGRAVDAKHKGRGYELTKGKYVQIDEDVLKAIQIESTHTVDIDGSCPAPISTNATSIDRITSHRTASGAEAFVVIRDAMQDEKRVALARIVMAHREHVIMLEPLGKGLLGTTLRYDYEVRSEKDYFAHIPSPRISKDMVSLAVHILESKATQFDPAKFQDEYEKALRKLVQRKAKGPCHRSS